MYSGIKIDRKTTNFYKRKNKIIKQDLNKVHIYTIINICIEVLNKSFEDLSSKSRRNDLVECRFILVFLLRKYVPKLTYKEIGFILNRDHSTIISAEYKCNIYIKHDSIFNEKFVHCENEVLKKHEILPTI